MRRERQAPGATVDPSSDLQYPSTSAMTSTPDLRNDRAVPLRSTACLRTRKTRDILLFLEAAQPTSCSFRPVYYHPVKHSTTAGSSRLSVPNHYNDTISSSPPTRKDALCPQRTARLLQIPNPLFRIQNSTRERHEGLGVCQCSPAKICRVSYSPFSVKLGNGTL